ncbi:Cobalamin biosynthesis protein CbiA [Candidatus Magnetomoraceae bacterium gMMP-1]
MAINLNGLVVIVGNYGSGKTEVSINLAVNRKRTGTEVRVGDLDLVNPYFRTREAIDALSRMGIEVVTPPSQYLQADLPILSPMIGGMIQKQAQLTILDVGGDNVGATVLSSLSDAFKKQKFRVLQVINPFRPFTETIEGCRKMRKEIETASRLKIDGIIGNANYIDETKPKNIYSGYEFVLNFAKQENLPLEMITVALPLLNQIDISYFSCPVLPIERQLVPPWKKASPLGPKNFILH